jgi:CubicO group peptidase (beta-lactamase class C family)
MIKKPAILLLLISTLCSAEVLTVAPETVGLSTTELARIQPAVQAMIDKQQIAGAITLVARKGQVVHFETHGMMDLDSKRPMERDAIMRFYSMTKPVTTVALMMMVEEGKCQLGEPVSKYIPEFKNLKVFVEGSTEDAALKREMTIKDLALHTSGLTYGFFGMSLIDQKYNRVDVLDADGDLAQMCTKLSKIPLLYQPGERWNYSVSTDVLGRVIEIVSGIPLDRFLEQRIFKPLGMNDTAFDVPRDKISRFATNYGPGPTGLTPVDGTTDSRYARPATLYSGGGGLVSTATDYFKFAQMLLNKGAFNGRRILKTHTVEMMIHNHLPAEVLPISIGDVMHGMGFGLGFAVRMTATDDSAGRVGEYGWSGAASTHFWISPKDELIVIALSQVMPYSNRLADALKPIVYEAIK